jgi:hypothetical protein
MEEKMLNADALGYLDEAMFTSSLISKKEREAKETDWKNVYPRTKAETEQMESLLQKANAVVEDATNQEYSERYKALSEVVDWSKKRHASWTWKLIAGALLGAGIFYYFYYDQQKDIAQAKVDQEQVNQWKEISVEEVPYSVCPTEHAKDDYAMRLTSAEKYKIYKLIDLKTSTESYEKTAKEYQQQADTAKIQENKDKFLQRAEASTENAVKYRAQYDSINAMDFIQIHAMAISDMDKHVGSQESWGNTLYGYMIFLLVLIPLYIITGYPHGYTITRHRRRSGCLNIFRKVGFGLASFCFGTGVAMNLLPDYVEKTTYSDGTTRTEKKSDIGNIFIIVLKVGLMIVGAFIFCFVASLIMMIETIVGLIENFNWSGWMRKLFPSKKKEE